MTTSTTDTNLTAGVDLAEPEHRAGLTGRIAPWLWLAALVVALLVFFRFFLWQSVMYATEGLEGLHPDWGHILVVPLISLWFLTRPERWHRLKTEGQRVSWAGLPLLIVGLFLYAFGHYPVRTQMLHGASLMLMLAGLVWMIAGRGVLAAVMVPLLYLIFFIRIGERLWIGISLQLQQIAAELGTLVLQFVAVFMGFTAEHEGNVINLGYYRNGAWVEGELGVAEACSGMRMLMAFVALGAAMAFVGRRRWWQRVGIMVSTVPIAIFINVCRVAVLGMLYTIDEDYAKGEVHVFIGLLMLIPAMMLFLGVGWVLDHIIVDEDSKSRIGNDAPGSGPGSANATDSAEAARSEIQTEPRPDSGADPESVSGAGPGDDANRGEGYATGHRPVQASPRAPQPGVSVFSSSGYRPDAGRLVLGLLCGAGIAALAGGGYYLLLATIRPDLITGDAQNSRLVAMVGVLLCGVGLLASPWLLGRLTRSQAGVGLMRAQNLAAGVAVGFLAAGAVGERAVVEMTQWVLVKERIELRHQLYEVPQKAGNWTMLQEAPPLPPEIQEELGTNDYFTRIYADTSLPPGSPGRVVQLHVAYYSGSFDVVPHVPENCFIGRGARRVNRSSVPLELAGEGYTPDAEHEGFWKFPTMRLGDTRLPAMRFDATLFSFESAPNLTGEREMGHVIYFFAANGKYLASSEAVRIQGFDPRDRYAYWCKVEARPLGVRDAELARERVSDLLSAIMPEINACLPDWLAVKAGRYPDSRQTADLN